MSAALIRQLQQLAQQGLIANIDYYFAAFIAGRDADPAVVLAAAMASHGLGQQQTCVNLADRCNSGEAIPGTGLQTPALHPWLAALDQSDAVGKPADAAPLIVDGEYLYLARYFRYECAVAAALVRSSQPLAVDIPWLQQRLDHYFGIGAQLDWQRMAAAIALSRQLTVITGGPGTGKTTTVVKILALLWEQRPMRNRNYSIRLAAPTGKAAARLAQSIKYALQHDASIDAELAQAIPTEVATIHRLLRPLPNSARFRHDPDNLLTCDVLLVDEISMIDIGLLASLLAALKADTRIILLGDRDQLPSVGAGQVLQDLCAELGATGSPHSLPWSQQQQRALEHLCTADLTPWVRQQGPAPIGDSLVMLQRSFRFAEHSGIGRLAAIVNSGDERLARQFMVELEAGSLEDVTALAASVIDQNWYEQLASPYLQLQRILDDPALAVAAKLKAVDRYQILCALREGSTGVNAINRQVESCLLRHGLIDSQQRYYHGRPIMISQNDHNLQLYNGDSGVILADEAGVLQACFEGADGAVRRFAPGRLPPHDCAYAISVHKSQGSEYQHVALVLPPATATDLTPLVSRELIYTGITRARQRLTLACTEQVLYAGLRRRVCRSSGLPRQLQAFARQQVGTARP